MKWRKTPEPLIAFLADAMRGLDCQMKKMFGYPAYFINGNMFIATFQENIVVRLPQKDRDKLMMQNDEVVPFEPMPGRVMKEYVVLPESLYQDKVNFSQIIDMSVAYVSSLPVKKKKA